MNQTQRRFDACIFDLDGTLANTLTSIAHFGNATLEHFELPTIPTEQYKTLVGNGADKLMRRMLRTVGAQFSEEQIHEFRAYYDSLYEGDPMALVEPYPGIVELLTQLKEEGFQLGVLSNKPDNVARDIVAQMFGDLFTQAHGQREGIPTKPDPTAVLSISADFGVDPSRVLYCGDSGVDMQTGKNAGMHPCGVLWGFREEAELRENGAEFLAKTAQELYHIAVQT
ncbi:MAG: HAD family hydrolase [Acutalibacter sp.]|jgi:phosphoglycolate phosphatase